MMPVTPYLFFEGRCEEALEFYRSALGAEVTMLMRIKESPDGYPPHMPPGMEEKVMHCAFTVAGQTLMGSDGMCSGQPRFDGFSLSIATDSVVEAEKLFAAISAGGEAQMPFGETFFSPGFGMARDRFGLGWMVMTEPPAEA